MSCAAHIWCWLWDMCALVIIYSIYICVLYAIGCVCARKLFTERIIEQIQIALTLEWNWKLNWRETKARWVKIVCWFFCCYQKNKVYTQWRQCSFYIVLYNHYTLCNRFKRLAGCTLYANDLWNFVTLCSQWVHSWDAYAFSFQSSCHVNRNDFFFMNKENI